MHPRKKHPAPFGGDLGYGVNSPIKGHLSFGGAWTVKVYSRYYSELITNKHNTSQTCLFCFYKTPHPLKLVIKKNKQCLRKANNTSACNNPGCTLSSNGEIHKAQALCWLSPLVLLDSPMSSLGNPTYHSTLTSVD